MDNKQKGFSLIGIIAIIVVLGMVGFVGYIVWNKNKKEVNTSEVLKTSDLSSSSTETPKSTTPEGYILYESESPKFSFVYPKEWDEHKDQQMTKGTKVDIYDVNSSIPAGVYPDFYIKYDAKSKLWSQYAGQEKQENINQPTILWKDDEKTVYDFQFGEGGVYRERVGFITENKIVFVSGPYLNGGEFTTYDDGYKLTSTNFSEEIAKSISF